MPRYARPAPEIAPESHWLAKLADLNAEADRGRGVAPHKPLLLFCALDMIDAGVLTGNRLEMSAELVYRFNVYWSFVFDRRKIKGDISLPFHALGSVFDRIWERLTEDGRPSRSRETTRVCVFDPSFAHALKSAAFRRRTRIQLINGRYFIPSERVALSAAMGLPLPDSPEVDDLRRDANAYRATQQKGRSLRFKAEVVTRYGFMCALTGYRLATETANIVEAAHIHQRADSLNDEVTNGLALTPNAHWMFDAGLWSVDKARHIIVAPERAFSESSPDGGFRLQTMAGQELKFQSNCDLRPDWTHFEWHRRKRFLG